MEVHLGSISKGFTAVMKGHVVIEGVLVVVPDSSVSDMNFVAVFRPDEASTFVLDGIHIDLSSGNAVTVIHGALHDLLLLVVVGLLFPNDFTFLVGRFVSHLEMSSAGVERMALVERVVPVKGYSISVASEDGFSSLKVLSGVPNGAHKIGRAHV